MFVEGISEILNDAVKSLYEPINEWKEKEKIRISEMVKIGWYPNWATFSFRPDEDENKTHDEFMIERIDENFDEIAEKILNFCSNRKNILQNAFHLYKEKNYIACIPLFLIQADGICDEEYGYFFTEKERGKGKASNVISEKHDKDKYDFFSDTVLEIFKMHKAQKVQELQLTSKINKNTIDDKKKGPNRSGILHGDQNHLDYGTKINAYKAFSFLAFIVFSSKDLLHRD